MPYLNLHVLTIAVQLYLRATEQSYKNKKAMLPYITLNMRADRRTKIMSNIIHLFSRISEFLENTSWKLQTQYAN